MVDRWIEDVELENVEVKWAFSHFDGRADTFNNEGDHNFTIVLPEETAKNLLEEGWNVKQREPYGDDDDGKEFEYTLEVKISYKYEAPKIYLIKNGRKYKVDNPADLADIKRSTCTQIDLVMTPSKWVNGNRSGISAYTKELYAHIKASRFDEQYADLETI